MKLGTNYRRNGGETSPFAAFENEVNRLLGMPYIGAGSHGSVAAADVFEDADRIAVELDLPGVRPEDVQVSFHEGVLTVRGTRKGPDDVTGYHLRERRAGAFERSFAIRVPVDADAVKGTCKDGVLTVTLPKTPEARPRQIQIQSA